MRKLPAIIGMAVLLIATPATALVDDEEDEAIAEEALPTLEDLPDGWEESSVDEDTDETGLPECEALDAASRSAQSHPNAESPNFYESTGATAQIEARIFVFAKAKAAKRFFKGWSANSAEDCWTALGNAAIEDRGPDAEVRVESLGVEGIGDDAVGRSLIVAVPGSGSVYTDLYVARVGRAIVGLSTQDFGGSLPEGLDLLELMAERVEEAL